MFKRSMILSFTAALLLVVLPLRAQFGRMSVDDRVKQLTEKLTLTKVQADSVRVILKASQDKMMAMRDSLKGDRDAMRGVMMKSAEATDKKIEALLTKEQKPKYEELKKERAQMRRRSGPPGGGN